MGADNKNTAIIVLPFENQTTSLSGQTMLRKMVFDGFSKKGYQTLSMEDIDGKLKGKELPTVGNCRI